MAVVITKSPSIINWDAQPIFIPTIGEGAEGPLRIANDSVAVASTDSIGSIYRLCRIPTNAKVKRIWLASTGNTTATADIDIAFSDSLTDGTQNAFSQLANPVVQTTGPADNKLFGVAQSIAALAETDKTFAGSFLFTHQNTPLWAVLVALGCTQFVTDPGGFFDLVAKVVVAPTVAGTLNGEVHFVE